MYLMSISFATQSAARAFHMFGSRGANPRNYVLRYLLQEHICMKTGVRTVQTQIKTDNEFDSPVKLTDSCVARLKTIAKGKCLRVDVEGGGCSGFQYLFKLDGTIHDGDVVIERDGVKLVVDETALEYLKGSTVDYHEELIRSAFRVINNPQSEQGCSCGASFSIKL
ncbi:unnamed protein product [Darwinula stevensoni]|uniref:Iron-sulfur cluster assembly 2 homolog, mitochondrial n=1 Tax=Darwinula stevensoni TaxID=69355 RepID=A0A7R8X3H5_9CRUS|nr:unnamed protein product [Darwinula stevensoni]CAG0885003.1 unnamed protein product [Darwinula stevensoni]